jgi:hypothetical protein
MNKLITVTASHTPVLARAAGERAQTRFWEFSSPTSATPTRAGPMAGRCRNSSPGANSTE